MNPDGNGQARADLRAANRVWRDIVNGRLVIEDHRDEGGRRYLRARRVDGANEAASRLTERERLVVGHRAHGEPMRRIALELGVSVPTVARDLGSALSKLGLSSELDLPAVFSPTLRSRRHG